MRIATLSIFAATILLAVGCSTTPSASASERKAREAATLARYQAAAGAPVSGIRIFGSPSWDTIDGSHIVYTVSPTRQYLMTLGGNCMDWASGPSVGISSTLGQINTRLDSVHVSSGLTCSIERIQPLDVEKLKSMHAAAKSRRGID